MSAGFHVWARLLFVILSGMVLYLTVKPNPAIQEIQWMPAQSTVFFDLHDGWKNTVGFGALSLAAFLGWPLGWGAERWSCRSRRILQAGLCCGIVVFMELLQLIIPTRFCDIKDMIAGSFGVLLAWLLVSLTEVIRSLSAAGRARRNP